jgi:hypothetical protein
MLTPETENVEPFSEALIQVADAGKWRSKPNRNDCRQELRYGPQRSFNKRTHFSVTCVYINPCVRLELRLLQ